MKLALVGSHISLEQSRGFWHNFIYFQGAGEEGRKDLRGKTPATLVVYRTALFSDQQVSA